MVRKTMQHFLYAVRLAANVRNNLTVKETHPFRCSPRITKSSITDFYLIENVFIYRCFSRFNVSLLHQLSFLDCKTICIIKTDVKSTFTIRDVYNLEPRIFA